MVPFFHGSFFVCLDFPSFNEERQFKQKKIEEKFLQKNTTSLCIAVDIVVAARKNTGR